MDDDYESLGFDHLDTLLPGHPMLGPILPGVDLTLWVQFLAILLAFATLGVLGLLLT